jgi:hypothetical protein
MTSHDFGVKLNPIPHFCYIVLQVWLPPKMMSQTYDLDTKNELLIESSHQCLKPKHLPVCTILLMQNTTKSNVHNKAYWKQLWQATFYPFINSRWIA